MLCLFRPSSIAKQRQLMEAYVRQKRTQNGMVLASDVPPMAMMRPSTATGAQHVQSPQSPHAYDGPLQFTMSPHNPDQMRSQSPAGHDGKDIHICNLLILLKLCVSAAWFTIRFSISFCSYWPNSRRMVFLFWLIQCVMHYSYDLFCFDEVVVLNAFIGASVVRTMFELCTRLCSCCAFTAIIHRTCTPCRKSASSGNNGYAGYGCAIMFVCFAYISYLFLN